ncbi:hypothetical protein PA01_12580 [Azoarcus sp. PA01]|nr:hypothetical protein PA01_12580 [Azoarcus sp. PA01]
MDDKRIVARLMLVVATLIGIGVLSGARASPAAESPGGVTILVEGEGWGSADREEIETLLHAVADELIGRGAGAVDQPIVVTHAPGSPVTLYERGVAGEYLVRLSARNRSWAQYAYQFGHELCHIMSNFDGAAGVAVRKRNQWFEEAVCEAAGLYALRSMASRWQTDAPYSTWKDYAPVLRRYADRLVAEPHRRLPEGISAGQWLQGRLAVLARDPYRRDDNEVVANLLLPLFERDPEGWAALRSLNRHPADATVDLSQYLLHWRSNAAREHRQFIDEVTAELGLGGLPDLRDVELSPTIAATDAARPARVQAGSAGPLPQ